MDSIFIIDTTVSAEQNYRRIIYSITTLNGIFPDSFQYNVLNKDDAYNNSFDVHDAVYEVIEQDEEVSYISIGNRYLDTTKRAKIYFKAAGLDYWINPSDLLLVEESDTIETLKAKVASYLSVPEEDFTITEYTPPVSGVSLGSAKLEPVLTPGKLSLYLKPATITCDF